MEAVKLTDLAIAERSKFVRVKGRHKQMLKCDAGSISQRACVYCGARVVLNPITDAVHLVHGPIGCAGYTWDIRGSLSSGSDLYRNSFSADLKENDIIFGGEKNLPGRSMRWCKNIIPGWFLYTPHTSSESLATTWRRSARLRRKTQH